jgi:integrase
MAAERRPKPWAETNRQRRTRYVWRFEDEKYRTLYYDDPEEARADATAQITELLQETWRDRSGPRMPLEEWIDVWADMLGDIEPTTVAKYKYFVEGHILPQFQGRQLGSLTFEEIEKWEAGITKLISARGRPYARSVAVSARSLLITILGDAVHARKIDWNPAERRRGRRGQVRVPGRTASTAAHQTSNVITPVQAVCLAERCALLSGRDVDFVMNVFAAWTGVRWGELLAVEGGNPANAPLNLVNDGISTYALDWQLRELGGVVRKSPPKDGSFRILDLPPFLADLMQWAVDNRLERCSCPQLDGHPICKGEDRTPASYLFLGPKGGHPRHSNYAEDFLTPAAEGLHPTRQSTRRPVYVSAEPWPGIPIRKGNKRAKAADLADGTWPNLTGKIKPHDYRHTHATWLEEAGLSKVIQMDRRGHALRGMDRVYTHVTTDMRERLCAVLEELWQNAIKERHALSPRSNVPLLDRALSEPEGEREGDLAPQSAPRRPQRAPSREAET